MAGRNPFAESPEQQRQRKEEFARSQRRNQRYRENPHGADLLSEEQAAAARQRFGEVEDGGEHDTRPDLRSEEGLRGSGASDLADQANADRKKAGKAKAIPGTDLREAEDDALNYTGGTKGGRAKKGKLKGKAGWWNKKRAGIAGAIAGIGVTGGIMGLSIISGPLQFIHLAHILHDTHFSHQENAGDGRLGKLYRFLRSGGSVGETRLGWLSSKYHSKILADLEHIGIKPTYGKGDIYKGFTIDTENENSPYKGMTPEEAAQEFEDKTGIKPNINGKTLEVNADTYWGKRAAIKASLQELHLNGASTAARARIMRVFGQADFHPLRIAEAKLKGGIQSALQKFFSTGEEPANIDTTGAQQTSTDQNGNTTTTNESAPSPDTSNPSSVSNTLKSIASSKSFKVTGGIAVAIGLVCAAQELDNNIGQIRYAQLILPMIRMGMTAITVGYQIESNQDVSLDQLGSLSKSFTQLDSHGNVQNTWNSARQIRAETGQTGGIDPLQQNGTNDVLAHQHPSFLAWTQNGVIGALCSGFGQAVTGVISVVVGVFSGGIVSTAVGFVASSLAEPFVIDKLAHWLAGQALSLAPQGALYGAIVDDGSLMGANSSAVHLGGVALSEPQVAQLDAQSETEQQDTFKSQDLFARIFNAEDYQSLTGHFADDIFTSFSANTLGLLDSVVSTGPSVLKLPFSIFSNVAHADTPQPYNYPFPEYDFSQADLDNSAVGDPYANAVNVAHMLDASCLNSDGTTNSSCTYISKAESCFGDKITKDNADHVWDVIPDKDVDMYDSDHYDPNSCTDAGNMDWLRLRFFILDTSVIEGYTCVQFNDPTSCSNNGESTQSSAPTGTTLPSGSAEQLANLILESPNISFQTPQERQYFEQVAQTGHQTACGNPAISTTLLGVILTASQQYKLVLGVFDDGHHCGDGLHDHGIAVDINGITPVDGSSPGTGNTIDWSSSEQPLLSKFDSYMGSLLGANGGGGLGQKECFTTTPAPSVPSNVSFFSDSCDHQHINVAAQ